MRLVDLIAWLLDLLRRLFRRPPVDVKSPPYLLAGEGRPLEAAPGVPFVWRESDG